MPIHTSTPLDLFRAAGLAAAFSSLAFGAAAAQPSRAQAEIATDAHGRDSGGRFLEGSWVRNEELSEDPVESLERHIAEGLVSQTLRQLAENLADRRRSLVIEFPEQAVLIQNAAGERLHIPVDGVARHDSEGNVSTAFLTEDSLEIVTSGSTPATWLWIERFYRQGERLVHLTETQNYATQDFRLRTVYDYLDGKPPAAGPAEIDRSRSVRPATIQIVPPRRRYRELLAGPVEVQTLIIDPLIASVEFLLDGVRVKQARRAPFTARVRLDHPPRPQLLEVRAYRDPGGLAGSDQVVLNRLDSPFGVRIAEIRSAGLNGRSALHVAANVSVPRTAALERVTVYRSDHPVATFDELDPVANRGEARRIPVDVLIEDVSPGDFVRVTAQLADGREMEDAELLQGAEHRGEIDVQLVQLQVLVVDRKGNPVGGLKPGDFEIREKGAWRPAEHLHVSDDVPLILGIAIDSSESMYLVWRQLHDVVQVFFEGALATDDRAFLVDFDDTVRLLRPLTGDKPQLERGLKTLIPFGGTALNDGLLFSLLQFRNEPGRRALIVVTDGDDHHSRSKRAQVTEYAERVGVPIYFITLGWSEPRGPLVKRLSRQTGGRLFRIHPGQSRVALAREMQQVFDRINEDLRHQNVLTYYTEQPPGAGVEPEVRTTRTGLRVKSVLPLEALR